MLITTTSKLPPADSIAHGVRDRGETPLTYGLLRQLMVDSGAMDEREAQRMDRAQARMLDA